MESTPDKNNQIHTRSVSKFEDSPVFNYISNLSPIETVKSVHSNHPFNSLSFSSPPSAFASPQICSHKESRFLLKRHDFYTNLSNKSSSSTQNINHKNENDFPKSLECDHGSPDSNDMLCNLAKIGSNESDMDIRKLCYSKKIKEETAQCDWSDPLSFDLSHDEVIYSKDYGTDDLGAYFVSSILELPQDTVDDLQVTESVNSITTCEHSEMVESKIESKEDHTVMKEEEAMIIENLSSTLLDKGKNLILSSREPSFSLQLRRCLVYEGALNKKPICHSTTDTSTPMQSNYSSSKFSVIGLHLNAPGKNSNNGRILECETPNLERKSLIKPNEYSKRDLDSLSNHEALYLENAAQTSHHSVCEEFEHDSPTKKRSKLEHVEETGACKRCNCKRSRCLKLYCECFAAGLYCIEPCSCQDCFNKLIHENTVIETRKQIESRNPLAFAPKVIKTTNAPPESGEDHLNKTPASVRHKRGCNCKKSSCLKKYCECYQGGAGCSISCRCVGCKNTFGQKEGLIETGHKGEEKEIPRDVEKILEDGSHASRVQSISPNSKRISPPNWESLAPWKGGRKLILRSIPPFQCLDPPP